MVTHKAELAIRSAFKRAGFRVVDPKKDVGTMPLWLMKGYRRLEGSMAVRVHGVRLWHRSQVRPLIESELGTASNVVSLVHQ
jgi:hypothetical protein